MFRVLSTRKSVINGHSLYGLKILDSCTSIFFLVWQIPWVAIYSRVDASILAPVKLIVEMISIEAAVVVDIGVVVVAGILPDASLSPPLCGDELGLGGGADVFASRIDLIDPAALPSTVNDLLGRVDVLERGKVG